MLKMVETKKCHIIGDEMGAKTDVVESSCAVLVSRVIDLSLD